LIHLVRNWFCKTRQACQEEQAAACETPSIPRRLICALFKVEKGAG
jgi:hypothetical protein